MKVRQTNAADSRRRQPWVAMRRLAGLRRADVVTQMVIAGRSGRIRPQEMLAEREEAEVL